MLAWFDLRVDAEHILKVSRDEVESPNVYSRHRCALALPALESMTPIAFAREQMNSPKRMVMICTSLGLHGPSLFPEETGKHYTSTPYLDLLKEHRDEFTLFSGLSHPDQAGADGHSSQMTWLTAVAIRDLADFETQFPLTNSSVKNWATLRVFRRWS